MTMKKHAFFLVFFLIALSTAASASINLDSLNKNQLNLGDKITVSYNLSTQNDMEALFKLSLKCQEINLDYYTIPIILKNDNNKSIVAPPLTANRQMLGKCSIKASIQSTENSFLEEMNSDEFEVTDKTGVKLETNSKTFFPGEKLQLTGTIEESFNPPRTLTMTIGKQIITMGTSLDTFNQTIELSKTMKSGEHNIAVSVNDSYGNKGEAELTITITQVPSSILIKTDQERINPGEEVAVNSIILDQANDTMSGKITIKITSQDKKEILSKEIDSNQQFLYISDQYLSPGVYTVKANSLNLKAEKKISVNTVEQIETTFDGKRIVKVKNTGNVNYEKYTEILLNKDGKQISIGKKLNLKPGEETNIDLYKEVPAGTYTVSFASNGRQNEFSDIKTIDERGAAKKTIDGLKGITGAIIGTGEDTGLIFKKPFLALFTVIAIIGLVVIIYRSEKERKKELQSRKIEQSLPKEPAEATPSTPNMREEHKKFVENMLKEKQFK